MKQDKEKDPAMPPPPDQEERRKVAEERLSGGGPKELRAQALVLAVELVSSDKEPLGPDGETLTVFDLADAFVRYISTGKHRPDPPAQEPTK
jgi:hypothetical protein